MKSLRLILVLAFASMLVTAAQAGDKEKKEKAEDACACGKDKECCGKPKEEKKEEAKK